MEDESMQPMSHQVMGYDRAITMFSPDGRLLQVEYAKKTIKQGSTAIGMICNDGVLLVTDKRIIDPLIVAESVEKIFQIDEHVSATAAGILSDARVLVERAQFRAQQHRVTFDTPCDILTIVKEVAALCQICTQSGGLRPFGVSLLIAGVDDGPVLYETDPTGIYFQYYAAVIGEGDTEIEEILKKEYSRDCSIDDGLKLAIKAMKKVLNNDLTVDRLDAAYVKTADKKHTKVGKEELARILKSVK